MGVREVSVYMEMKHIPAASLLINFFAIIVYSSSSVL